MKTENRTVAQYAVCHDCDKTWSDYRNHRARKAAYAHAQKTGHAVTVETATVCKYNGKS